MPNENGLIVTDGPGPAHDPASGVPDTADMIDDKAPDPMPDEITDTDDPSYVKPARNVGRPHWAPEV